MGTFETNHLDVELSGGATLRFVVPTRAVEVAPERLPEFNVSGLPGAHIALRRGFLDDAGANVHIACVEAPSDRWAPSMEDVVLGVANGVAHRAMSERLAIEEWNAEPVVSQDQHFEQQVSGKAQRDGSSVKLSGQHVLGFEGAQRDVVLCSLVCDEARDHNACRDIVAGMQLEGLVAAPPPSVLVQAVFFAAEKPWDAAGIVGAVGLLVVGLVLAKRPRPKP